MNDAVSATAAITPLRLSAPVSVALTVPLRGEAPLALTQLPAGQTVQAVVMSHPDAGIIQLKSDFGTFNLRLAIPVPEGTVLTLQAANGQFPQMRIMLVDGKPAAQVLHQIAGDGGSGASGGGATTGSANTPVVATPSATVPGTAALQGGISATVLRMADPAATIPGGQNAAPLPVGTTLTLRIVEITPPPTTGGAVGGAITIGSLAPPVVPTMPGATPASSPLTGVVVNHSPAGQPLIQTPLGLLSLSTTTPVPQGATIALEVVGNPTPPTIVSSSLLPPPPLPGWQGLTDAFNALRIADPGGAQNLLGNLPVPGGSMASAMASMAAAVRSANVEGLLGPAAMQSLSRLPGGDRLTQGVKRDIEEMRASLDRPTGPGGEWRALTMPFNSGYTIEPIRLYIRPPPPDDENDKEKGGHDDGTRFIVDVTFRTLGPLQLDGLIQRERRRFDLIIRSHVELPPEMRQDIAAIFAQACSDLNMTGGTQFQKTPAFYEIQPSAQPFHHGILA